MQYASAKLDLGQGSDWVEYIRGKDLLAYLREHPEKMLSFVQAVRPGRTFEDQVADFCDLLIRRELLRKAERKFKKPKPGRKKLVKWPRNLEAASEAGFSEDAFYVWAYDRPTSPWTYLLSALVVVFTIGCCLFPLAPHHIRIWVVYSLLGLLSFLLGLLLLRYVLFSAFWIITGGELWLFPNMTSDQVPITEAFWPIISFKKPEKQTVSHWLARLTAALLVGGTLYMLYAISPGAVELRNKARKTHEDILTMLERYNQQKLHLGSGASNNTAAAGNSSSAGAAGASSKGGAAAGDSTGYDPGTADAAAEVPAWDDAAADEAGGDPSHTEL